MTVDDYTVIGSAPWFYVDALSVEGFVDLDEYTIDLWLSGDV